MPTVGHALLHILASHTAMRVGQIAVWRRAMGLPLVREPFNRSSSEHEHNDACHQQDQPCYKEHKIWCGGDEEEIGSQVCGHSSGGSVSGSRQQDGRPDSPDAQLSVVAHAEPAVISLVSKPARTRCCRWMADLRHLASQTTSASFRSRRSETAVDANGCSRPSARPRRPRNT